MLFFVGCVIFLELFLYIEPFWKFRKPISVLLILLNTLCLGVLVSYYAMPFAWFLLPLGLVMIFRYINFARLFYGRMHESYLRRVSFTTSASLFFIGLLVYLIPFRIIQLQDAMLAILLFLQLVVALLIVFSTLFSIIKSRLPHEFDSYADQDLPTVSICIPARNETPDLEICLRSLLASTYPKLEILVLDDCSTDKTPDIIKQFAHEGVRFINGSTPSDSWLPKNQAYQRLAQEASGQYLLFCGVDTRFAPQSVAKLVAYTLSNNLAMFSVLPRRLTNNSLATFVQPMRYWWELTVPRWLIQSPPVLSTCWLISAKELNRVGNFEAVRRSVLPERYFAKLLARQGQYSFGISNDVIDVQTVKGLADQRQTAIRVRYPQLHRRPELVLLMVVFELTFLLLPPLFAVVGIINNLALLTWASGVTTLLLVVNHVVIISVSNPANVPAALLNLPVVVTTELVLGIESMLRYEFGRVAWKDRNVCIPVMHVIPHLPAQEKEA